MLVTFISQCEKKAINRTRRILDAFANRIGDNVWQTAITEDGLTTVKKLLRQSATKSTAVSCHRVRTRQRTELVWIVGNRNKFNEVGIVPVNWTEKEMDIFYQDAQRTCESLFSYEPFRSMKGKFNIVAVASPSTDSGVSVPRENLWKETAVHSHFDTFYSDRYLTTSRVKSIHNALAGIPYEHIIILANTDVYGGGGIYNSYTLTTAHHPMFKPVVVHEFGHSFGGLADEYFYEDDTMTDTYPLDVEPWEQNITTRVNFASKWEDMLPPHIPVPTPVAQQKNYPVGVYEGGGYSFKGIYRPAFDCRMRTNEYPTFCPVCQRAIQRIIEFYTGK